jgi:hypothetical protein
MSDVFPTGNAIGGGVRVRPNGLGNTLFSLMGCLFISDKFIFLLIYIIIMDNSTNSTPVDSTLVESTVPSYNKKAYNLEAAILNAIARFNAINLGLGIRKSNPFENPDIRTQEIDRILRDISNMRNLGLYGVNPINRGQAFTTAVSAQINSAKQLLGLGKGGKKSRRRRRAGKRTRKHH